MPPVNFITDSTQGFSFQRIVDFQLRIQCNFESIELAGLPFRALLVSLAQRSVFA